MTLTGIVIIFIVGVFVALASIWLESHFLSEIKKYDHDSRISKGR